MFARSAAMAAAAMAVGSGSAAFAADSERHSRSVEIVIERLEKDQWNPVNPQIVFDRGDEIRFRVKTDFAGFLYVVDRTPSGEQLWLFPTPNTGSENAIEAGREYTIPATDGSFEVPSTPGYDTVFWVVSPAALNGFTGLPASSPDADSLVPRCRAAVTTCVDPQAGPRMPAKRDMPPIANELRARDLSFDRMKSSLKTRVSAKDPGAIVYQIRIAHR